MGEILTKTNFFPQSEPHTAKLCFSVVLKHFGGNLQRTSLVIQKVTISERNTEILRNFFFLTCLKNVNPEENLYLFKQLILIKLVKGDKY